MILKQRRAWAAIGNPVHRKYSFGGQNVLRRLSALALLLGAGSALAAPQAGQVKYALPGDWVLPPPVASDGSPPPEAPLRVIFMDHQVRIGPAGEESYNAYRMKILKPEALPVGNVSIVWAPSSGTATVHHLRIVRDGEVTDLLKEQSFQVIQREGGLEQSMLDGYLTAMLQAPGLRVGDELEFASTVVRRDRTLGEHVFGFVQLPVQGLPGAFRFRLNWPDGRALSWRATRDLPQALPAKANGQSSITYELRSPGSSIINDGAPARYNVRRLVEYSDFGSWSDVSRRFAPLYEKAAVLSSNSTLHTEAAKIAAGFRTPAARAEAALRLVQDHVRYVYVGLDGGNYRPATADETWQRRFGDCKAKTALLLALLRELKIDAEPVLVDALGGDGMDVRLPRPDVFNHVVVRAKIGGETHWLDGTRLGDRYLDMLPAPAFRWALAVKSGGSELEAMVPRALPRPQFIGVVDIDASKGFDKPASVNAQHVMRQDEAYAVRVQLAAMSAEDADRAVRSYWRQEMNWIEPSAVSWRYDERRATLVLALEGEGKPEWKGNDEDGRSLDIPGAGFYPPDLRRRPREQDQGAPWATNFPRFKCYATSIRLPAPDSKWRWVYYADPMNLYLGGTRYWRASGMKDNVVRTVMSSNIDEPEISAAEAKAANDAISGFNNNISRVYQASTLQQAGPQPPSRSLPFEDRVDWTGDASACSAPTKN